jgi:hypothetical protein
MHIIIYILSFFALSIITQFIRFKLTRWEKVVEQFGSEKRPDLKPIYGYWSEFRLAPKGYPMGNTLLKVAPTNFGLYIQFDLKFEPIKFYNPVMIPWSNLIIGHTQESRGKGGEEYRIETNGEHLGSIILQTPVSEQIKEKIKELGIQINSVLPN